MIHPSYNGLSKHWDLRQFKEMNYLSTNECFKTIYTSYNSLSKYCDLWEFKFVDVYTKETCYLNTDYFFPKDAC